MKKFIICIFLIAMCSFSNVYADNPPDDNTTVTEEASTEATTEKKNKEDSKTEKTTEKSTEAATEKPKAEPTTEEKTEAATESPESSHGEIVNTSSGKYLIQGTKQITKVYEAINGITEKTKKEDIMKVRYMYNALTMAQKARVSNESVLYEWEKKNNITYDYSSIPSGDDSYVSTDSKKGVNYIYNISEEQKSISISIKYTVDNDADGKMDVPDINLKGPDGSVISISLGMTEIKNANIAIKFTWTDQFMQMDIANCTYGHWMITTDLPVLFSSMDYAGSQNDIESIPEYSEDKETTPKKEKQKMSTSTIIRLILFFLIVIGYIVWTSYKKSRKEKIKKENKKNINHYIKSDEDIEKKKNELRQLLKSESDYQQYEDTIKGNADTSTTQNEVVSEINNETFWNGNEEDDFLDGFN